MAFPTSGLVAYWKLDESSGNAADSVGSNTLANTNVTYSAGKINNGANFNGSSTKLQANSSIASGAFSWSFWFKTSSSSLQVLFNNPDTAGGSSTQGYVLITSGQIQTLSGSGGSSVNSAASTYADGNWHHCVYTCGSGTGTVYIDGSSAGTGSQTQLAFAYYPLLGRNNGGNYLNGSLDEVGVWSRVLTSGEVTTLYNGGSGLPYANAYTVAAAVGAFSLTGISANFLYGRVMAAAAGTFTLTGVDSILRKGFMIAASVGDFVLTGINATLKLKSWTFRDKSTTTFSTRDKASSSWTFINKN